MTRTSPAGYRVLVVLCLLIGCVPPPEPTPPPSVVELCEVPSPHERGTWILIDTKSEQLSVMREGKVEASFPNVAFGAAGPGRKKRQGDDVTPLGNYHVTEVRRSSRFNYFIGLDYPSSEDASRALREGRIDRKTYNRVREAHVRGTTPPQDTILGGHIGIHGVGRGDIEVHRMVNWTSGCIALEDSQLLQLLPWIKCGMVVKIQ